MRISGSCDPGSDGVVLVLANTRVWPVTGVADMRKALATLAARAGGMFRRDRFAGKLFVF